MMNYEVRSVVCFLTIENNFRAKIYRCLCTANGEENVMNLRNIQQLWSVFQEGRINIHRDRQVKRVAEHDVNETVMHTSSSQR